MSFKWNMRELERLINAIEEAPQEAAKEWLEKDYRPLAYQMAPKRTGEHARSIDGEVSSTGVEVFASAPHSIYVEEGTSKSPAQPTVRPALEATLNRLYKRIDDAIARAIK